jgi:CheY-like chemotaxis protein
MSGIMESRTCIAILVLEDEQRLRTVVARYLEAEGFQVYQAENRAQALQVLRDMPRPALVLADLMMSSAEGPDLFAALRPDDRFVILPVVVVSEAEIANSKGYARAKKLAGFNDLLRIVSSLCLRRI